MILGKEETRNKVDGFMREFVSETGNRTLLTGYGLFWRYLWDPTRPLG